MIAVIAKVPVQADKKDEALEAVRILMAEVAKEEGTLYYTLNIDEKNPDTLVFIERYQDMNALAAHGSTTHFKEFMEKVISFASGEPEINVLSEIESI